MDLSSLSNTRSFTFVSSKYPETIDWNICDHVLSLIQEQTTSLNLIGYNLGKYFPSPILKMKSLRSLNMASTYLICSCALAKNLIDLVKRADVYGSCYPAGDSKPIELWEFVVKNFAKCSNTKEILGNFESYSCNSYCKAPYKLPLHWIIIIGLIVITILILVIVCCIRQKKNVLIATTTAMNAANQANRAAVNAINAAKENNVEKARTLANNASDSVTTAVEAASRARQTRCCTNNKAADDAINEAATAVANADTAVKAAEARIAANEAYAAAKQAEKAAASAVEAAADNNFSRAFAASKIANAAAITAAAAANKARAAADDADRIAVHSSNEDVQANKESAASKAAVAEKAKNDADNAAAVSKEAADRAKKDKNDREAHRKNKIQENRKQLLEVLDYQWVTISLYCAQVMNRDQLQRIMRHDKPDSINLLDMINWLERNCSSDKVWDAFREGILTANQWEHLGKLLFES